MVQTVDELEDAVLSLPRPARERLREALNASLDVDPEVEQAWDREIRCRVAEMKAGRAEMIEGVEFDRELDNLLK
jgi:hypothetical protein